MSSDSTAYLDGAVLPSWLQLQHPQSSWHHHLFLGVVRFGHALKELEAVESVGSSVGLVGDHATDGAVEDSGWCAVVEGATLLGVDDVALVEEVGIA